MNQCILVGRITQEPDIDKEKEKPTLELTVKRYVHQSNDPKEEEDQIEITLCVDCHSF